MASGLTPVYAFPYPLQTDSVDVAADVQLLAQAVEATSLDKAPILSPAFTGVPLSTTPADADSSTKIATTAFVKNQSYLTTTLASSTYAPIASPTFTGTAVIPTLTMGTTLGDRVTIYGTLNGATSYALGIESGTLYYRANGTHRWYISTVADAGVSEKMELNATSFISNVPIIAPLGTTALPSLRIPHGVAPTTPTNGDIWTTTIGMYARINGNTVGPFGTGATYTASAPTAITGALWADSTYNSLSVYTGTRWASMTGTVVPAAKTETYSLVVGDEGSAIRMAGAITNNITVPTNTTQPFPIGSSIMIIQTSAIQTVISGAGVTFLATPGLKLRTQNSAATLLKVAADTWSVVGDLAA